MPDPVLEGPVVPTLSKTISREMAEDEAHEKEKKERVREEQQRDAQHAATHVRTQGSQHHPHELDDEHQQARPVNETAETSIISSHSLEAPSPAPRNGDNDEDEAVPLAGYLTVLGGFLCLCVSFGFLSSFGVWASVYVERYGVSESTASWCGSVQQAILLASNLIGGPLLDQFGPRPLLLTFSVLFAFSCMMISLTTQFWQVMLAQAIIQGIAMSISFGAPITATILWWKKKSPPAVACTVAGSSIGGVIWPIMIDNLLKSVGFAWTWRTIGFVGLVLGLTATVLITVPIPPARERRRIAMRAAEKAWEEGGEKGDYKPVDIPKQPFFYPEVIRRKPYAYLMAAFFILYFSFMVLFFYLPAIGIANGMSKSLAFYSVACLNAASFFGRLLLPFAAPRFGTFNVLIPCVCISALLVFCANAVHNVQGVLVIGCFYGFWSGAAISLQATATAAVVPDKKRLGAAIGQGFAIVSISALLGPPIAGWILATKGGYPAVFGYSGGIILLSAFFLTLSRISQSKKLWVAV